MFELRSDLHEAVGQRADVRSEEGEARRDASTHLPANGAGAERQCFNQRVSTEGRGENK